jgi:hypothetical protein
MCIFWGLPTIRTLLIFSYLPCHCAPPCVMLQVSAMGFTAVRLPFSNEMLRVKEVPPGAIDYNLNPELRNKTPLEVCTILFLTRIFVATIEQVHIFIASIVNYLLPHSLNTNFSLSALIVVGVRLRCRRPWSRQSGGHSQQPHYARCQSHRRFTFPHILDSSNVSCRS